MLLGTVAAAVFFGFIIVVACYASHILLNKDSRLRVPSRSIRGRAGGSKASERRTYAAELEREARREPRRCHILARVVQTDAAAHPLRVEKWWRVRRAEVGVDAAGSLNWPRQNVVVCVWCVWCVWWWCVCVVCVYVCGVCARSRGRRPPTCASFSAGGERGRDAGALSEREQHCASSSYYISHTPCMVLPGT